MTTQPFWQSMRLSKKRLSDKGLRMDVQFSLDTDKEKVRGFARLGTSDKVHLEREEKSLTGRKINWLKTNRKYYAGNRCVSARSEAELSYVAMTQYDVENGEASCPNCGYMGKIASFVDGCDACGSQYSVKDFEPKVSAFSLEENIIKKFRKTTGRTVGILAGVSVLLMILTVVLMVFVVSRLSGGVNDTTTAFSALGIFWAMDMSFVSGRCLFALPFMYIAMMVYSAKKFRNRYEKEEIVQALIPGFSGEEFCQELEYKLRNIHFTDDAGEVAVFSRQPLGEIVSQYGNVIDCNLVRCKFLQVQEVNAGYCLNAEVTMKITTYNGKKIRSRYEKLELQFYGKKQVVQRKIQTLRAYKCRNCGSSLNILEGSVCSYCQSVFDYSDYGWMIERYTISRKPANVYWFSQVLMIMFYIGVFFMSALFAGGSTDGDSMVSMLVNYNSAVEKVTEMYDDIVMPDDIEENVTLMSSVEEPVSRKATYEAEDGNALAKKYLLYVLEEGFEYYGASAEENIIVLLEATDEWGE